MSKNGQKETGEESFVFDSFSSTFDSGLLYALALRSANRCDGGRGDFDAITAIMLSYSALEAFVNEVAKLSFVLLKNESYQNQQGRMNSSAAIPQINTLALAMKVAEDNKASTAYKFDLAWEILSGSPIEKGDDLRQSIDTLNSLRNDLVHAKSEETKIGLYRDPEEAARFDGEWLGHVVEVFESPRYFRSLEAKHLLTPGTEGQRWVYRICSKEVAEWACATVKHAAIDLTSQAPIGSEFRNRLETYSLGNAKANPRLD